MVNARQQRPVLPPIIDNPANRNPAEADAVIAALTPDQPGARPLPACALIRECDLECSIN